MYRLLRDLFDKGTYLIEIQVLKWFRAILEAVVYLHSNLILHSWLNPKYTVFNIFSFIICLKANLREISVENDLLKVNVSPKSLVLTAIELFLQLS